MAQITKEQLDKLNSLLGDLNSNLKKSNTPSSGDGSGGGYSFEGGSNRQTIRDLEEQKEKARELLALTELDQKTKQEMLQNLQEQNLQ
mgnify:FL=1